MYKFSPEVLALLYEAGWLEQEEFTVVPSAIDFLSEFGGLSIRRPLPSRIYVELSTSIIDANILDCERVNGDAQIIGEALCPIGECEESWDYLEIGDSGRIFIASDTRIYFLGESVEMALETLLTKRDDYFLPFVIRNVGGYGHHTVLSRPGHKAID